MTTTPTAAELINGDTVYDRHDQAGGKHTLDVGLAGIEVYDFCATSL